MNSTLTKLFVLYLSIFISFGLQAQVKPLTKDEKKEIKSKLNNFKKHPETYKSMVTNYDNSIKTKDTKLEEMELEVTRWKAKYKLDLAAAEDSIAALKKQITVVPVNNTATAAKLPQGTAYGVQLGNYKFYDITKYFGTDKYLIAFYDNECHQYVISFFTEKDSAEACRKDIKKLGIKDAFVTKYIDGKRVPFDMVKEGTPEKKDVEEKKQPVVINDENSSIPKLTYNSESLKR